MKRIVRERQTGRTTELIKLCAENGGYIVCRNNMVDTIANQAKKMGFVIPYPLSYKEFTGHKYYGKGIRTVYIDDADALLRYMFCDVEIGAITVLKN